MQLGTCALIIKFKNMKKWCVFFVDPGNGQVLLGMPVIAALNIINLNIDSVQVEVAECKINIGQEMQTVLKGCTNMATGNHTTQTPMVKMAKLLQTNHLITFSHQIM